MGERDPLLDNDREAHPTVDGTVEVKDACCGKWAKESRTTGDLQIAHHWRPRLFLRMWETALGPEPILDEMFVRIIINEQKMCHTTWTLVGSLGKQRFEAILSRSRIVSARSHRIV